MQANYAILVPVAGQLVEDETLRFVYSADCLEDLEVYNSPNCDEDHLTGLTLHPGSIIRAVAIWTTTTRSRMLVFFLLVRYMLTINLMTFFCIAGTFPR